MCKPPLHLQVPHILQSVVLLDTLNNDFDITYILKHNSGSWEKVSTHGCAEQGVGMLLNYKMLPADKLQVKVSPCVSVCGGGDEGVCWCAGDCQATVRVAGTGSHLPVWFLPYLAMFDGEGHQ